MGKFWSRRDKGGHHIFILTAREYFIYCSLLPYLSVITVDIFNLVSTTFYKAGMLI